MPSVSEILDQVGEFLAHRLSLEQFEDWSAEYSWNIHQRADHETQALAYRLCAILDAYSEDATEDALRQELATAIRPFRVSDRVYARAERRSFGHSWLEATSASGSLRLVPAANASA